MADKKATSMKWLTIHVAVYSAPILVTGLLLFTLEFALFYLAVNAGLHWIVDLITSRLASAYRSIPRAYHIIVGFDQFIHALCLLASLSLAAAFPSGSL
jgi:hypothetical protein